MNIDQSEECVSVGVLVMVRLGNGADYLEELTKSERLHEQSLVAVMKNREEYKAILSSSASQNLTEIIATVILAWELADGVNGIETGDVLVVAWEHHPRLVASWFGSKPESMNRWLRSQDFLFNGLSETGSFGEAEKIRMKIIAALESEKVSGSETIAAYLQVLNNLEVPNWQNN
ncbi:hypothetical protein [Thalassolituus marinus]|uniref:Uncharacterized protein n=1 Tax=Thalassolituus marinus TaxID=671053 RepID=A0ABS7ZMX1_9GAMM|nr:hypothetical protein [Thalassolituus marinus]MCA6062964.1 hypothetical protein [Thalassolituus marinus]